MGGLHREVEGSNRSLLRSSSLDSNSFLKDGRNISIGDCALFKPLHDSPPFIGIIRCLSKGNDLQLGVNWLYRPAELKLAKDILLNAAPNEIFYSFHEDEIPASSLLHPCKVAFLPRDVELPAETSSFVCRRVYDIVNKCLWWLTDQDHVNEREQLDQLLHKTRTEIHAMFQSGGHSPKQVNGLTTTSQLKPGSDNGQNSWTSFPSQVKGKRRERRGDQVVYPVKREHSSKTDGNSDLYKPESNLKSEIAKITEKGGIVDLDGVEKLVQLMQSDRMERKMDLISHSMLAGVVAATDKFDCLNQFVQLRGLLVLDEWLQEIHKGKIDDGNSLKVGNKTVEEFLLVLLCALDKLPVDLHALQMCNIGRSVNHLRSHKNLEIQRKARDLVDTWKKRVEAEMISIDSKSGSSQAVSSWPSKSRLPEAYIGGMRNPSGSDAAMKSSTTQLSASKTTSVKSLLGESNTKSASSSPVPVKSLSSPVSGKETDPRISVGGTSDSPITREDRSSSSNQSHSYSPSFSGREEGKNSNSGSTNAIKILSSSRRRRNSGYQGTSETGNLKETSSNRTSPVHRSASLDILSRSASKSEKDLETPIIDGSSHKLIVKISNRVCSPAQGVSGGSLEDLSITSSQASSPVLSVKHNQPNHNSKVRNDTYKNVTSDMKKESWKINDLKDVLTGSDDGAGLPAALPDKEQSRTTEDSRKLIEGSKGNELESGKFHEDSFSSMNALIESCVKYSEANSSLSIEDHVGMNLLASVATREMSKSDLVSPTDSTERSTPAVEEVCMHDEAKSKSCPVDHVAGDQSHCFDNSDHHKRKQGNMAGGPWSEDGLHPSNHASLEFSADRKCGLSQTSGDTPASVVNKELYPSCTDMRTPDTELEMSAKSNELKVGASLVLPISIDNKRDDESGKQDHKEKVDLCNVTVDDISEYKHGGTNVLVVKDKLNDDSVSAEEGKRALEVSSSNQLCAGDRKTDANEELNAGILPEQKLTVVGLKSELTERADRLTAHGQKLVLDDGGEVNSEEAADKGAKNCFIQSERQNFDAEVDRKTTVKGRGIVPLCSDVSDLKSHHMEVTMENKEMPEHLSLPMEIALASPAQEARINVELRASNFAGTEANETQKSARTFAEASFSAAGTSDPDAKVEFDLNEGFDADDGKSGELTAASTTVQMINPLPFTVNSISSNLPASIMVAAAAKGPFVPREDLLGNKGQLGWMGSAASSAFRPAEPRKVHEMPLCSNLPCPDTSMSKHGRTPLDFDLNVADERILEEMASRDSAMTVGSASGFLNNHEMFQYESTFSVSARCSSGLDLDLNRVDDAHDMGQCSTSSNHKVEGPVVSVKSLDDLPNGDVRRSFDLNNGPGVDDAGAEQFLTNQQGRFGIISQLPSSGIRLNNQELGNISTWFPAGNSYSTVTIPSILPDRGVLPFPVIAPGAPPRIFGPAGSTPFTPDVYRGSVMSTSTAVSFQSNPFQYPIFPFGTTPLPSASFLVGATSYVDSSSGARLFTPTMNSQLLGPVGAGSSQFPTAYMVGLPDSSSNGGSENKKWTRQVLDLNAGPGTVDTEFREQMLPLSSRQLSAAGSQAVAEEQARMYSVSDSTLKRKEPDGGLENKSFRYKQFPWQ